jgi:hypothetical protein
VCTDKIYRIREDGTKVFSFFTPEVPEKPEIPLSDRNLFRHRSPCQTELYDGKVPEHGRQVLKLEQRTARPSLTPQRLKLTDISHLRPRQEAHTTALVELDRRSGREDLMVYRTTE